MSIQEKNTNMQRVKTAQKSQLKSKEKEPAFPFQTQAYPKTL